MTSSHIKFGAVEATTSSAQSPSLSTAATGTNLSWSVGTDGSDRGGRKGTGGFGRSAWSRGPPVRPALPGQSQSPSPSVSQGASVSLGTVGDNADGMGGTGGYRQSAWSRRPPVQAAQSGQSGSPPASASQGASVSWGWGTESDNTGSWGVMGGYGHSAWSRGPPVRAAPPGQSQFPPPSASQGAGQDKTKGKGKGKKKRNKKSKSTGQSQADNLHEEVQDLKIENGTEDSNEEVCFICAEPVKYYSVSTCNHRTCHVCALRLRALYGKLECAFCKELQQSAVFTVSPDKPYEEYNLDSMLHRDSKLSVLFETQEMMEETLILLRFNCPDSDCDYIGNGWGDLKLHTRAAHSRLICELCIQHKKVFAHEHALYPPSLLPFHLPSMIQGHRQNAPKVQIEGGAHPMCEFCRECFFGDDELYAHFRESHEECFVCKRNDIRNQYFQDYDSLEKHFREAHHPCTESQCLARKFVVFGTVLDLKVHMLEEHSGDMTSRDRKEARRVVTGFAFNDRYGEREREREPPPVPRQSQATGQNRRRKAFEARLTIDGWTTIGESNILETQPAIESNRTLTQMREDVDPAVADRHDALISRLQCVASNPTTAIPAVKTAMRGYRSSESSARDLISTIWNILDRNLEHTASIVNAFADLLDEEEKKQDLLASWRNFAIEQRRQFPELVPIAEGGNYAIATGRVLNAKYSTIAGSPPTSPRAVWDRVAQGSSMATQPSAISITTSSQFPALGGFSPRSTTLSSSTHPALRSPSQNQRTTPWTSPSISNVVSTVPRSPLSPTTSVSLGVKHRTESTANGIASWPKPSSPTTPSSSVPSGRNMSPTSNVAGISISAFPASSASAGVSPGNEAKLVALLTNGPSAVGNYASAFPAAANNVGSRQICKLKHRGLLNSGNMCFANSVLQMLVYTAPFQRLFYDIGRLRSTSVGLGKGRMDGEDGSASITPLVDAMVEFVKEFVVDDAELYEGNVWSGNVTNVGVNGWGKGKEKERKRENSDEDEWWENGDESEWWENGEENELWGTESFLPSYVYEAMKEKKRFDDMQQEDAEEFLGFLLETLEEELVLLKDTLSSSSGWQAIGKKNRIGVTREIKGTESPITNIFGGKFRTTLKVPHKKDSVIVEDWRLIRLDIQRDQIDTVEDALGYISQRQSVQVPNPARPGTSTLEAHQVVHIDALPPVLVLHMQRFCYDTSVGGVVKVGKHVTFGPELEIRNDVLSHAIRKPQRPKYKLFGVLYHHGLSAFGGFYTLDVLHPTRFSSSGGRSREGWIRIFDELASDVRHEDVFGEEGDDDRSAYLLFYRRIR